MRSVYVIKPEAMPLVKKIRQELELNGLRIVARTNLSLDQADIEAIYQAEPTDCLALYKTYLMNTEVEAGIVEGVDAVAQLLALVGEAPDPAACAEHTLRRKFGGAPMVLQDQLFFLNAIHAPATVDDAENLLAWYHPRHFEQVREVVLKEMRKYCTEKERWKHHFLPVVKYARQLAKQVGADLEVVELAAWLHDFTRIQGDIEDHHLTGADEARKLLADMHYDEAKIDNICHCIQTHRGSKEFPPRTVEAEIVASADAMAHIGYAPTALFMVKRKKIAKAVKMIRKRAKRNWRKIMQEGREIIQPQYTALEILLSNYKSDKKDSIEWKV